MSSKLSDYELQREQKLRENRALLMESNILNIIPKKVSKQDTDKKYLKRPRDESLPRPPARRSLRAKTSIPKDAYIDEINFPVNRKRLRSSERISGLQKKPKYNRMVLSETSSDEEEEETAIADEVSFIDCMAMENVTGEDVDDWSQTFATGSWRSFVHKSKRGVEKDPTDSLENLLSGQLQGLRLEEVGVRKVTQNRVSRQDLHPSQDRLLVGVGSVSGEVGLWSPFSSSSSDDSMCLNMVPHKQYISSLKFHPSDPTSLLTTSFDTSLRVADLTTATFHRVYQPPQSLIRDVCFRGDQEVYLALEDGSLLLLDLRSKNVSMSCNLPLRKFRCLSVHPLHDIYVATGDLTGQVKLFDIRRLDNQKKKAPVASPFFTLDVASQSIESIFFSHDTGSRLLVTSLAPSLRIYDTSALINCSLEETSKVSWSPYMQRLRAIPHNNNSGRYLTNFRATWLPGREDAFVIGSMEQPRRMELYNAITGELVQTYQQADHLKSVTSCVNMHSSLQALVGSNSSGRVFVFKHPDMDFNY